MSLPARPLRVMLVAAEPSGDQLGAALMRGLRAATPAVSFTGCGGAAMAAEGFETLFPTDRLSVMGLADVLPAIPEVFRRAGELARHAVEAEADVAVLIDSWGFNHQVATRLRKRAPQLPVVKYVAPQVWASRPQRVHTLKREVDCVLTLLPFEPPWFEAVDLPAYYVGNPNFEAAAAPGDGAGFRAEHGLGDAPLLCVLPGSRGNEIRYLLPVFEDVVRQLTTRVEGLRIVIPLAPNVADRVEAAVADWPGGPVLVRGTGARRDAFAAARAALAASGTVTTELALQGTPMVVAYKAGWLTTWWAKRVVTTKYATILNVMADAELIPERIAERCTPDELTPEVERLLTDENARAEQLAAIRRQTARLDLNSAPGGERAAAAMLAFLRGRAR
ncbi:MAG: lipid-A-disaccharide synthase [Pseudomonadota bacterium]